MGQLATAHSQEESLTTQLQGHVADFTAFYEQHAYLAYNLALRIAGRKEPAERAARRGFLQQLTDRPSGLVAAVTRAALEEPGSGVDPESAGGVEAQRLMRATAALSPPERAALALADLAEAQPPLLAAALGVPPEQATKLVERARHGFADALGLARPEADAEAAGWIWAPPPDAIWQQLYPEFHRNVERRLRKAPLAITLSTEPPTTETAERLATSRRSVASARWRLRLGSAFPRVGWQMGAATVLVLALAGVATARLMGGSDGQGARSAGPAGSYSTGAPSADAPTPAGQATIPADAAVKPHRPLTPAELDKLRLRELSQLDRYTKRQANKKLPLADRQAAARGISNLQRAADRRLQAELKREQRLRDELARERAKANAPPPPPPPRSKTLAPSTTAPSPKQPTGSSPTPSGTGKQESKQTCLLDEDTGQYYCPQ